METRLRGTDQDLVTVIYYTNFEFIFVSCLVVCLSFSRTITSQLDVFRVAATLEL